MKKAIIGIVAALAFSTGAMAKQNNNNPDVVVVGGAGSVQISQCASVAGNCNNPDMTINVDGNINGPLNVTGDLTINGGKDGKDGINGKDGADGKDGLNGKDGANGIDGKDGINGKDGLNGKDGANGIDGKDGADGAKGEKGDTGAAGKDGTNGKDGKDADMSIVNGKVDRSEFEADQDRQDQNLNTLKDGVEQWNKWAAQDSQDQWGDIRDLQDDKANKTDLDKEVQDRVNGDSALNDKIDTNKTEQASRDQTQDSLINTKVDKDTFEQDQKRQDQALTDETTARIDADNKLQGNIDSNKEAQKVTDAKQDAATAEVDRKVDVNKAEQTVTDTKQNVVISNNSKNIAKESTERKEADSALNSRIDSNDRTLVQHDQRITSNTNRVGAVEQRQQNFEASTNKRFSDLDKKVGDNRKVASAGIAGAGAMANIPGLSKNSDFSVGAGIGGYDGEQAVAVGFNARVSENVTTKATVSTNSQSEVLWGAGVGIEW